MSPTVPTEQFALLLMAAGVLLYVLLPGGRILPNGVSTVKPNTRQPRRFHWPFRRHRIPWKLGHLTVDLRGGTHTIHAVVAGMSGTGKSTAVLTLLQSKLPALVVAFDNSRPIRDLFESEGWTIWQPGGTLGWNILAGPAQVVSEALTAGFAKTDQDTGYNRGLAQMRLWATLDELDAHKQPRTLQALVGALERPGANPDDLA